MGLAQMCSADGWSDCQKASKTCLVPAASVNVGHNWSKKSNCRAFAPANTPKVNKPNQDFFFPFLFAFIANQTLGTEFPGEYMALNALFYVGPRDSWCSSDSDSFCGDDIAWESPFSFNGKMKFPAIVAAEKSLGDSSKNTQACQAIYIKSINTDFRVLFCHLAEALQA